MEPRIISLKRGAMKEERNRLLREFYANHPYLTYQEVGEVFNISRQRIETILKVGHNRKHDGKD